MMDGVEWWKGPGFMWVIHECSGLKSADSCLNTIKAGVIPTITSLGSLRCAHRSTHNHNSNLLWSPMLLKEPFWVSVQETRQCPTKLLTFVKWNNVCCLLSVKPELYICTSLIRIDTQGRCCMSHAFEAWLCLLCVCVKEAWVCCCNKPATQSSGANPATTVVACLKESPKGALLFIYLLFILGRNLD